MSEYFGHFTYLVRFDEEYSTCSFFPASFKRLIITIRSCTVYLFTVFSHSSISHSPPSHASVSPISGQSADASGALPLHWATRNPEIASEVIELLLKSFPEAPARPDNKVTVSD